MVGQKVYETTVDLSRVSSTDDLEGEMTQVEVSHEPTLKQVRAACDRWTGQVMQTPPSYSAIKVNGQRAYAMARRGEEVKLQARPVQIDSIEIIDYAWPMLTLAVTCGKGTYIRSLGRNIGEEMGVGGVLTALRRTRVGRFDLADAVTLESLPNPMDPRSLAFDASLFE